jgi:hypothetical protein
MCVTAACLLCLLQMAAAFTDVRKEAMRLLPPYIERTGDAAAAVVSSLLIAQSELLFSPARGCRLDVCV